MTDELDKLDKIMKDFDDEKIIMNDLANGLNKTINNQEGKYVIYQTCNCIRYESYRYDGCDYIHKKSESCTHCEEY